MEKSKQAQAAALIRKELKKEFPSSKFNVTSATYGMGDKVDVMWIGGPEIKEVNKIIKKYQWTPYYDGESWISNIDDSIPQALFVIPYRREFPLYDQS